MEDTTGTAMAIPQGSALEAVFRTKDGVDPIIDRIQREVRAHAPDLTTKKGRDAIASLAHKVSKSKVALDDAGKALTEDAKKHIAAVDAARKKVRDTLDALRDECRKPLTDWEAAEERRIAACKAAIHGFIHHGMTGEETSAEIRAKAEAMKAVPVGPDFGEFEDQANGARDATLVALRSLYQLAKLREDQAAELEALRAEKAAGPARRLTGLLSLGRGIPRPHMEVTHERAVVGEVTSGTFSPTLAKGIALALLPPALIPGTQVTVLVRGREEPFEVVKPPFVTPGVRES